MTTGTAPDVLEELDAAGGLLKDAAKAVHRVRGLYYSRRAASKNAESLRLTVSILRQVADDLERFYEDEA